MEKVFVYGNNKISDFLKKALPEQGYSIVKSPNNIRKTIFKINAIVDLVNAENISKNDDRFSESLIHNLSGVKDMMDLAARKKAAYIFVYKESLDLSPESSLFTALDFISEYAKKTNCKYATIQVEDIFGTAINTNKTLVDFLTNIVKVKPLKIENDLNDHYLLHQKDFIEGMDHIIRDTISGISGKNYSLIPEEPITEIEMANFLKELSDLDLLLTYQTEDQKVTPLDTMELLASYPLGWTPKTTLEDGILEIFKTRDIPSIKDATRKDAEEELRLLQEAYLEKLPARKNQPSRSFTFKTSPKVKIAVLVATLVMFLSIPSITYAKNLFIGTKHLKNSSENLKSLNIEKAQKENETAKIYFDKLENPPAPVYFVSSLFGVNKNDFKTLINTAQNLSEIIKNLGSISYLAYSDAENILSYNPNSSAVLGISTDHALYNSLKYSIELLEITKNDISNLSTTNTVVINQVNEITQSIEQNEEKLSSLKNITPYLSKLLGYEEPRKFLVVFQNSNELRATGGFIGSYAILQTENGKLKIEKIDDIYNPDGQIELNDIVVNPPLPLRKAFGYDRLFIRDANWDINYQESAKQIKNLYELATDEKVDGVIAVNLLLIKDLLKIFGPIDLVIYNEQITAENFYAKAQHYSESNFFAGSSQKRTFLSEVTEALFSKLVTETNYYPALVETVFASLKTKDILIYDSNDLVQKALLENDWAGSIKDYEDDYLYVVDSNLGANKANIDVKRSISYKGFFPQRDSGYTRLVRITYDHEGVSDIWPSGDYLNHLRIIVPKNAALNSAKLVANGESKNITTAVNVSSYSDKAIYSTDILVEVGKTLVVEIEYESQRTTFDDNEINILIQKQPGTEGDLLDVSYVYPIQYENDIKIPVNATLKQNMLTITTDLEIDRTIEFPL